MVGGTRRRSPPPPPTRRHGPARRASVAAEVPTRRRSRGRGGRLRLPGARRVSRHLSRGAGSERRHGRTVRAAAPPDAGPSGTAEEAPARRLPHERSTRSTAHVGSEGAAPLATSPCTVTAHITRAVYGRGMALAPTLSGGGEGATGSELQEREAQESNGRGRTGNGAGAQRTPTWSKASRSTGFAARQRRGGNGARRRAYGYGGGARL